MTPPRSEPRARRTVDAGLRRWTLPVAVSLLAAFARACVRGEGHGCGGITSCRAGLSLATGKRVPRGGAVRRGVVEVHAVGRLPSGPFRRDAPCGTARDGQSPSPTPPPPPASDHTRTHTT